MTKIYRIALNELKILLEQKSKENQYVNTIRNNLDEIVDEIHHGADMLLEAHASESNDSRTGNWKGKLEGTNLEVSFDAGTVDDGYIWKMKYVFDLSKPVSRGYQFEKLGNKRFDYEVFGKESKGDWVSDKNISIPKEWKDVAYPVVVVYEYLCGGFGPDYYDNKGNPINND